MGSFSDVSLNNVVDDDERELDFWKSAPSSFGELVKWPLGFQGIVSPHDLSDTLRKAACYAGITEIDSLDKKAHSLWTMMQRPTPTVILIHCTAGCDRTGEMVAAYRIINGDFLSGRPSATDSRNISQIYAEDVAECGRPPNYYSTTAL